MQSWKGGCFSLKQIKDVEKGTFINIRLSRHSITRGSSTGLVPVGPTKIKACKSELFNEGTSEVKIMNDPTCQFYYMERIRKVAGWQHK